MIDIDKSTSKLNNMIKETDLFKLCRSNYLSQGKFTSEFKMNSNEITFLEERFKKDDFGILRNIHIKSVIKRVNDYCLTYREKRTFTNNKITNLDINVEFLLTEIIKINACNHTYGVMLLFEHNKSIFGFSNEEYTKYSNSPTVVIKGFDNIPFGEILLGTEEETKMMFEDNYSGLFPPKKK